jgi:kinesin family protein 18/19
MIVNVSPSIICYEDTINTLNYASKAKNIKTDVKKNVHEHNPTKYDLMIDAMKKEINELKNQLETKSQSLSNKNSNLLIYILESDGTTVISKKVESLQNQITQHFQEEIKIKKDIIDLETKINQNKLEINQEDNEKKGNKAKTNKSKKKEEIDILNSQLDEKYVKQYEIIKRRDELQKQINLINKEQGGTNLSLQYQYYTVLLENMNLKHKKQTNANELVIKEIQVKKLFGQIKLRDQFINRASTELKKKNVDLKVNANIKTIDDLEIEPVSVVLPQIVVNNTSNLTSVKTQDKYKPEVNKNLALPNVNVNLQREVTPTSK